MSADRWATFDCYGTLIDWRAGIGATLARLWPGEDAGRLLACYHSIEPDVQAGRAVPYREVLAEALGRLAAQEGLDLPVEERGALGRSLPDWPPFPEAPGSLSELRERGWRLAVLSNTDPDLLAASLRAIGVPVDLQVTALEAGSYKPAHGHWSVFFDRSSADRLRHVHVAASLFHDVAPAAELGLAAVWINREGETSDLPRARELADLRGLADSLDELVPG
ncbi:MAG: HAD family hydrolase [Actinobacteria bacterium]|nr:HAD family hydrolase [Actinomycetota bacterium]